MTIKLKKLGREGFLHLEAMLLGVLVIAIVSTGLYVYNTNSNRVVVNAASKTATAHKKLKVLNKYAATHNINHPSNASISNTPTISNTINQNIKAGDNLNISASQHGYITLVPIITPNGTYPVDSTQQVVACTTSHWPSVLGTVQFWIIDKDSYYRNFLIADFDSSSVNSGLVPSSVNTYTEPNGTNFFSFYQVYSPGNLWHILFETTDTTDWTSPIAENDSPEYDVPTAPFEAPYPYQVDPAYLPLCPN